MSQRAKRYTFYLACILAWCLWLSVLRTAFNIEFDDIVELIMCFSMGALIGLAGSKLFPDSNR